jgi:hypothetical protein
MGRASQTEGILGDKRNIKLLVGLGKRRYFRTAEHKYQGEVEAGGDKKQSAELGDCNVILHTGVSSL